MYTNLYCLSNSSYAGIYKSAKEILDDLSVKISESLRKLVEPRCEYWPPAHRGGFHVNHATPRDLHGHIVKLTLVTNYKTLKCSYISNSPFSIESKYFGFQALIF